MLHICRTIRRHFSLRQVVHWSAEIQTNVYDPRKEGVTDRSTKRVNSRSLTKLLFRILQNSRKNGWRLRDGFSRAPTRSLDDCAASKDVKGRTSELVNLAFSGQHMGTSVWVLTQKITGITASFRENVVAIVLFYTPSAKITKANFDDYAGELSLDEYKGLVLKLKEQEFSYLVFSFRHPYGVKIFWIKNWKLYVIYQIRVTVFHRDIQTPRR